MSILDILSVSRRASTGGHPLMRFRGRRENLTIKREGARPLQTGLREPETNVARVHYIRGALGFCCHRAIRVPVGSSNTANHPWPITSAFGEMIFPPAFLTFSTYSSTEFTEM